MIKSNYEGERQNAQSKQQSFCLQTESQFSCLKLLYAQILAQHISKQQIDNLNKFNISSILNSVLNLLAVKSKLVHV